MAYTQTIMIDIKQMHEAYMKAALWSSTDDDGDFLDESRDASGITEETRAVMLADCERFVNEHRELIEQFMEKISELPEYPTSEQVGHDFWLTRNGCGVGFWDRGTGWIGDELSALVGYGTAYPPVNLFVGDDGLVR